jgi:5-methylcytosine-specific restriction protein B
MTISPEKVRLLTAAELGVVAPALLDDLPVSAASDEAILSELDDTLVRVRQVLEDGYAGVILTGVPGTGKSRHADLIALKLVDADQARFKSIQFHPSYQYEDFVEGYVIEGSSFTRTPKTFGQLCIDASQDHDRRFVLVIDEMSRTDVARVFGEAFTYLERSKRGREFILASGTEMVVPENLFIIATMNPWDRGADELDMALERRFAFIEMKPSREALRNILTTNGLELPLIDSTIEFFDFLQDSRVEHCRLGHGYFVHAKDRPSLLRVWEFQLAYVLERACGPDKGTFAAIKKRWDDLIASPPAPAV